MKRKQGTDKGKIGISALLDDLPDFGTDAADDDLQKVLPARQGPVGRKIPGNGDGSDH